MEKVQNVDESGGAEPGSPGDEFEPTAEMMVNDFDDEHTLDEEEARSDTEDQSNELSNLEKEKDMPLEALLAMYGYNENEGGSGGEEDDDENEEEGNNQADNENQDESSTSHSRTVEDDPSGEKEEEMDQTTTGSNGERNDGSAACSDAGGLPENQEDMNNEPFEEDEEEFNEGDHGRPQSLLSELYKDHPGSGVGARQLRSGSRPQSEDEEEEDDGDYSPEEDDWKKTIMVGSDYQAQIPEGDLKYDTVPHYDIEDKLLWDPAQANDSDLTSFMVSIKTANEGKDRIPQGSHVRDDEQALYLLLQCDYDLEEAIRRNKSAHFSSPNVATMSVWSEEECRNFETGLRMYGKDFYLIQQNKVRTRSVGELVQFYYLWKKTERHDVFANKSKLEKKKYTLHPGTTYLEYRDFMEKFLDEQDSSGGPSSSHVHSLLSSDSKRRASPLPMMQQGSDNDTITPDEVRILKSHVEDLARHLAPQELESLVQLTAATRVPNGMINQGGGSDSVSAMSISQPDNKMHSLAQ